MHGKRSSLITLKERIDIGKKINNYVVRRIHPTSISVIKRSAGNVFLKGSGKLKIVGTAYKKEGLHGK